MSNNNNLKSRLAFVAVLALVVAVGLLAGSFNNVFARQSADDGFTSGLQATNTSPDSSTTVLGSSRSGEVEFYDTVKSINGNTWVVGSITVIVNSSTLFKGTPQVGSLVEVEGFLQADGSLLAKKIGVEDSISGNSSSLAGDDNRVSSSGSDDSRGRGGSDDSNNDDHGSGGSDDGGSHDSGDDHGSGGHGSDD